MKAVVKQFRMENYRKIEKIRGIFGKEREIDKGIDPQGYYHAIADFLTVIGPARVIGIQNPGGDQRWLFPVTDVWYWQE